MLFCLWLLRIVLDGLSLHIAKYGNLSMTVK